MIECACEAKKCLLKSAQKSSLSSDDIHKENEPALVRRLLRAHFSGYELVIKVLSKSTPDKYTLPYIDAIEARAEVTFHEGQRQ